MVISDNVVCPPNSNKNVYEYNTHDKPAIFESGFYSFVGDVDVQCKVLFFINGKPSNLWRDQPVFLQETIPKNSRLEVKIINSSANTHLINVNLHIKES